MLMILEISTSKSSVCSNTSNQNFYSAKILRRMPRLYNFRNPDFDFSTVHRGSRLPTFRTRFRRLELVPVIALHALLCPSPWGQCREE